MPRSLQNIIDHAEELANRFERMEPSDTGHRAAVAVLRDAVLNGAEAERRIADAVRGARDDGLSWTAIGVILGTSGEAARKRFGTAERAATAEEKAARIQRSATGKSYVKRESGSGRLVADRGATRRRSNKR